MKKLIIALCAIAFTSCKAESPVFVEQVVEVHRMTHNWQDRKIEFQYVIIEIDGCEYIKNINYLTHKGNCKNPVHKHNQ